MISSPVAFRFEAGGGEGGALGGDAAAAPEGAELRGGDEREAAAAGEEALGGAFGLQTGALGVSFRCRFGAENGWAEELLNLGGKALELRKEGSRPCRDLSLEPRGFPAPGEPVVPSVLIAVEIDLLEDRGRFGTFRLVFGVILIHLS